MTKNRLQRKINLLEHRISGDSANISIIQDVINENKKELKKLKQELKKLDAKTS